MVTWGRSSGEEKAVQPFKNELLFYVNGKRCLVRKPQPSALLADYLRDILHLKGTKVSNEYNLDHIRIPMILTLLA